MEYLYRQLKPVDVPYRELCFSGTRQIILGQIFDWAKDVSGSRDNIFWLNGSPGAGKSAIAASVATELKGCQIISFFFQRDNMDLSNPTALWRTVAYKLAAHNSILMTEIEHATKTEELHAFSNIQKLFQHLIQEPLQKYSAMFPSSLVLIIDALDECGIDNASYPQKQLYETLTLWNQLPKNLKLIITSRQTQAIASLMKNVKECKTLLTGDLVESTTSQDIFNFLNHEFEDIAAENGLNPKEWPGIDTIQKITNEAAGLFIWAKTVIKFITDGFVKDQLSHILTGQFKPGDIDQLYLTILDKGVPDSILIKFQMVVGCLVYAEIPPQQCIIKELLSHVVEEYEINQCLKIIKPILAEDKKTLQISHQSVADFFKTSERSKKYFMNSTQQHKHMILGCLKIMNAKDGLRFNICDLETSHVFNHQIYNLAKKIENSISPPLNYACRFWTNHLSSINQNEDNDQIMEDLKTIMYIHVFHWLEVLSLTGNMGIAIESLRSTQRWLKVCILI